MKTNSPQRIEEAWKAKIEASNEQFNAGKFKDSLTGYTEALCHAEALNSRLNEVLPSEIPITQIFALTCNNIAFTYEGMGQPEKGAKMLKRVVYYLMHLAENRKVDSREIQSELTRAVLNYTRFASRNGLSVKDAAKVFEHIREQFPAPKSA